LPSRPPLPSSPPEKRQETLLLPPEVAKPLERAWTEPEAFAYCSALTKSHYENFPVGSFLAPAALQASIHSLYAFMRTADDFSDENRRPGDEPERLAYLASWERMLSDCERGQAAHPIFIALRRTLETHRLPVEWLRDLLHAFKLDVTVRRYRAYEDVLAYCRYSANPVGRLILTLFGYRDEERYALSDAICTGLQLANHWQDVAVDLLKDRVYLPQEHLDRFGLSIEDLKAHRYGEPFRRLMAFEVESARALFVRGRPLPERVTGRLKIELRLTWSGGVAVLDKIQAVDYDVFKRRPTVTKRDWLKLGLLALAGRTTKTSA
jgi:squalene synthase HpnC